MKKATLFFFVSTFVFTGSVFAEESPVVMIGNELVEENVVIEIAPETPADEVFDSVQYFFDKEGEHVVVNGTKDLRDATEAYKIKIDKEEGTYLVEEKAVPEMNFSAAATTTQIAWVKAITDDPVGVDLVSTKLTLSWYDYGSTIGYKGRTLTPWAANPSSLGTHWYNLGATLANPILSSTKTTLNQRASAYYYNYDFLDNDKKTTVNHTIDMTAKNNQTYDYTVEWTREGESWITLDLDIETN